MPSYLVKLLAKAEIAEGTMAFAFEKPPSFSFKAGQFIRMTIENPPENDDEGNSRSFSLACSPNGKGLIVATRMRDTAFKRVLKTMRIGSVLKINGPLGMFTLPPDTNRPLVFLTGGIGITPFLGMITFATETKSPQKIFLFYSNRRPEDAAFFSELQMLEKQNPNFKFIPTMTQPEKSTQSWNGEKGYITQEMIKKYVEDLKAPVYFLAGPPAMVENMLSLLRAAGIDDDAIKMEEFVGY